MKKLIISLIFVYICNFIYSLDTSSMISLKESYNENDDYICMSKDTKYIENEVYPYYVICECDDTEEVFIWMFEELHKTMEHFKWLESTERNLKKWRNCAFASDLIYHNDNNDYEDNHFEYYIHTTDDDWNWR